jgi:CHAT domain-containing protein
MRWFRLLSVTITSALLAIIIWNVLQKSSSNNAMSLLARAYSERRTLEVRIPGAEYAPISVERGVSAKSLYRTESLIEAELSINNHVKGPSSDPNWLQAQARMYLLEHDYESAIQSLEHLREIQSVSSPQILTDLASAYFEQAESADRPVDYGNAIEYLGEALSSSPDDPLALFNRAISCEKAFLYSQAQVDWEHYLRVDPKGEWADDARRHLSELRLKVWHRNQLLSAPLLTYPELANLRDQDSLEKVDDRMEEYLQLAVTKWLPTAYPVDGSQSAGTSQARVALRLLAQRDLSQHEDHWLSDLLLVNKSPNFPWAVKKLSDLLNANDNGDAVSAQLYAKEADSLFTSAHSVPGALRARVEYVFATHVAQAGNDCLKAASRFQRSIEGHFYPWLNIQFHLEHGTCYWLNGDLGSARKLYNLAASEAGKHRYKALYLRTQDHIAALDSAIGNSRGSWERLRKALDLFWTGMYPPMRGYNLYYNLHESARIRRKPYLQLAAWQDGLKLSDSFSDNTLRAMAHSLMADVELACHEPAGAERELTRADQLFNLSPQVKSTRVARLEAATREAEIEIRLGNFLQAVHRLQDMEPEVANLSDDFLSLLFYTNLGEAETRLKDIPLAESSLRTAISFAEKSLSSLKDERAKLEWSEKSSVAYRNFVELKLRQGDAAGALEIWESYRGASLRNEAPKKRNNAEIKKSAERPANSMLTDIHTILSQLPTLSSRTILSYARLNDAFVVWMYDNRGISVYQIQAPSEDVESLARSFRRLCADRDSDLGALTRQGRRLYELLIAPFEGRLSADRSLVIEADGALEGLAFEALKDGKNRYLADRFRVTSSLGLFYRLKASGSRPITTNSSALIAAISQSNAVTGTVLPSLPEVWEEGENVAHRFNSAKLLQDDGATLDAVRFRLARAEVFHFAGHAIASARQTGLLLSDGTLDYASLSHVDLSRMQLAVLSACDTIGDRGGAESNPESLVRLFEDAGVPRVVASRWAVDSASTKTFMEQFYSALMQEGDDSLALGKAEAKLRAKQETSHPYHWAAFTEFAHN